MLHRPEESPVTEFCRRQWDNQGMNTQQRIDRLEDALANLGTIMEAQGRWGQSENPVVTSFGARFNEFVLAVARERAASS